MIQSGDRRWGLSSIVHSTSVATESQALPKASPPESVPENVELPITSQISESDIPYVAKHLEGAMVWDKLDSRTQENGELIDDMFKKSVKSGRYRDDKIGFSEFIKHYEKVTDTKNSPLTMKVNVIAEFLRYSQRRSEYES